MSIRIPMQALVEQAKKRPAGYLEDVLAVGIERGGQVEIGDAEYELLCGKYRKLDPGAARKLLNYVKDTQAWIAAGMPIASDSVQEERERICRLSCDYWAGDHCRVCGCGPRKWQRATSSCPLPEPKWRAVNHG